MVAGIAGLIALPPSTPGAHYEILDHSCGTGEAVALLAHLLCGDQPQRLAGEVLEANADVAVRGIELDSERAASARSRLTTSLTASALSAKLPTGRVGLLFSNPPYDAGDKDDGIGRLEHTFLKRYTLAIKQGGVLVHIIGIHHLANSAAYLARNYADLRVFRFPNPEYARFRQIAVLGRRHSHSAPDKNVVAQLQAWADAPDTLPVLPCPDFDMLETLVARWGKAGEAWLLEQGSKHSAVSVGQPPQPDAPLYEVAADPMSHAPFVLSSGYYSQDEALREARTSGIWSSRAFRELVLPDSSTTVNAHPLLPLRDEQAALLVSVGLLNNMEVTDGQQMVLVKGSLHKEYVTVESRTDERGKPTLVREKEIIRAHLSQLDLTTGEVATIPPDAMQTFIGRFKASIRQQMSDAYPPLYTPDLSNDPNVVAMERALGHLARKPKGAQLEAILATAISLRRQKGTILSAEQGGGKVRRQGC